MRVLFVAEVYAWPPTDGYRLRMANMIEGLAEVADVDLLVTDEPQRLGAAPAPPSVRVLALPEVRTGRARAWFDWLRSGVPRLMTDRSPEAARSEAQGWLADHYDAVVYSHVDSWWHYRGLVDAPEVVDFDNLEDQAIMASLRAVPTDLAGRLRWAVRAPISWWDARRWHRMQLRCAAAVDRVLVCSELDARRSGCANAVVVPNGAEPRGEAVDHRAAPTGGAYFVFVGLMSYPPNADAVRWFVAEVWPEVRRRLPGSTFRIVGRGGEVVAELAAVEGVEVRGEVEDLAPELASADVSVVPIRTGSGTRLKVAEALANGLPTVSTRLGAEGIDVVDGTHVLLADGAEEFAAACVRAATDEATRRTLVEEGSALWRDRYRWSAIRSTFAEMVEAVTS